MIDWDKLVKERNEWVAKNFPPYPGEVPGLDTTLGIIEEFGELAHAHLKLKQGIRGTVTQHETAMKDAIGDMTVYLLGVMSVRGITPRNLVLMPYTDITLEQCIFEMLSHINALGRPYRRKQGENLLPWHLQQLVEWMMTFCNHRGWSYEAIVNETWGHVQQRDWNKHREEGAARDDPAVKDPKPDPDHSTVSKDTPYG